LLCYDGTKVSSYLVKPLWRFIHCRVRHVYWQTWGYDSRRTGFLGNTCCSYRSVYSTHFDSHEFNFFQSHLIDTFLSLINYL
jgi:hypothetical protein